MRKCDPAPIGANRHGSPGIIVLVIVFVIRIYNRLVTSRNGYRTLAQIDADAPA
jgi:hypothetical protein